ncbi:MAG: HAD family phosphatase [Anaerolineae bacterium]|nr:HAD family phosphatase [Anaerolineae bacterium]
MGIHAVIWDVGGVLVRTEDHSPREKLAAEYGFSAQEINDLVFGGPENNRAQLGEISHRQHWDEIGRQLELDGEGIIDFEDRFFAGDRMDFELVDFIRGLKRERHTAILSNGLSNLRVLLAERWQIDDAFHDIIVSAEVGLMKPDPAIYELTLETIGFEAGEALFIDDMPRNIQAAQECGLHAIRFENAVQIRQDIMAMLNLH